MVVTGKRASDLFVRCLEQEGVEYIFGLPGEENLRLLDSIRRSGIRFILTRHEQAAAFMAATYGRLTGRAGVVLATLGPGATNLVTGVAHAQLAGIPLLVITGQKPVKTSKQGLFQLINAVQMMQPITKMSRQIVGSDLVPSIVRQAFKVAEQERPGAVHLELPEDVADEETSLAPLKRTVSRRPSPDPKAVEAACMMIQKAERPLILIAAGANRKRVKEQLEIFVEKTGIPFFTTQMGKGVLDERSELCLGTAALTENDYLHCAIERADLIISVGHDVTEKPPAIMGRGGRKVIHVNFYPADIDEVYCPVHEVVGDIARSICAISDTIKVSKGWDFSYFKKVIKGLKKHIMDKSDDPGFPLKPQRIVCDLREVVPPDGILALDNGMYKIWIARNYPAYEQNTVLLDNALASMGGGLPSAIAAKLVCPDRTVVCVTGDGGFMMNSQEMETAVRLGLDLTILIIRDNGYGMVKWKQDAMGLEGFGLEYGNPDFITYAESFGAKGHRIKSAEELKRVLARSIDEGGIHLIDCPVDYSENMETLTKALTGKRCLID